MHFTVTGLVTNDSPWANVFWVRNGNAQIPSPADFDAMTLAMTQAYISHFIPLLSSQLHVSDVKALYYGPDGADLAAEVGSTQVGSDAASSLPASVALAVGWAVQQHYKGGHPRTYLSGIPSSKVSTSRHFTQAFVDSAVSAANAFHQDVNDESHGLISGCKLGTVSFVLRKAWRAPPVFRDFTPARAHADIRIDSMRRRVGRDIPP